MADVVVGPVVEKLISLLGEESNLLRGIHKEVEEITRDLRYIQAFLKDAEQRAEAEGHGDSQHGVKLWVEELREAALKIDDVIDEYTHFMEQRQGDHHECLSKCRFIAKIGQKVSRPFQNLATRHDIASKIQGLRQTVREINQRSQSFGFSSTQQGPSSRNNAWYDPRDDSRFLKETEVVGIEAPRDELQARLVGGSNQQTVISLVGMPGIGKTTLANQVFDCAKAHFDCHAWIDVSQSYNKLVLIRSLIKKLCQSRNDTVMGDIDQEMNYYALAKKLSDYLQGKRYFIIFDDVWDTNFWAHVKNGLPVENGRIVITTRNMEVARFCRTSSLDHIHEMELLNFDNSWKLFCNKAFYLEAGKNCPSPLEAYSREIVQRCGGLPLAIVVIAGLLATKKKIVEEWRKLLMSLSYELERNEHLTSINKILSLSYNDLPYNLKSCFLYVGVFPEDYLIRCKRLVRQWIAEGFVEPQYGKTLEAVAEEYLVELLNRSIVQVSKIDIDGNVRICRVHDMIREFIIKKMVDLKFGMLLSENTLDFSRLTTRRLSILPSSPMSNIEIPEMTCIRSIFVFHREEEILDPLAARIASHLKLLKVLDFEDCRNLNLLPDNIGNLFQLRYLSVRGTRVRSLPRSIRKLANLETLDIKISLVHELPAEINKLSKLRHLLGYTEDNLLRRAGVKLHKGFGNLKSVQKLHTVECEGEGVNVIEEVSKLTELRKLGMTKLTSENAMALCCFLPKLKHLESLELIMASENEVIDFESIPSPPQSLKRLYLTGPLKNFPEWITQVQNLEKIGIWESKLEDDPLTWLQKCNLLEIHMGDRPYIGEKLEFKEGAFPRLKVLRIFGVTSLNSLTIEEGALPNLEEFYIGWCPRLNEIPHGLLHLASLKLVRVMDMWTEFLSFQKFQSNQSGLDVKFGFIFNGKRYYCDRKQILQIQNYVEEHDVEWNSSSYKEIIVKTLFK